jgi:hypothetical protein
VPANNAKMAGLKLKTSFEAIEGGLKNYEILNSGT